jgi:chromosome segregation ATPase
VKDGETKLIVAFDLGGAFLSSSNNKDKFNEAKKMVNDFAIKTTKEAIAGQRKAAEKVLGNLTDEQHDLEKKQEKLNSNIEDYKAKIEDYNKRIKEAQDDLAKNKTDQEKKKAEADAQKKVVDAVTAKENSVE